MAFVTGDDNGAGIGWGKFSSCESDCGVLLLGRFDSAFTQPGFIINFRRVNPHLLPHM